jgi:hypothetical protein
MTEISSQKKHGPADSSGKTMPAVVAIVVFIIGQVFFPPESQFASDRVPHDLVLIVISGVAAALVYLAMQALRRSTRSLQGDDDALAPALPEFRQTGRRGDGPPRQDDKSPGPTAPTEGGGAAADPSDRSIGENEA